MVLLLAGLAAQAEDEPSDLVPEVEVESYTNHDVDEARIRFRPGKGVEFKSEDGRFALALGLRAMYLYELENDPNAGPGEDQTTQEVMIRRARVTLGGNMWGKDNKYKVELAFSPRDESVDDTGYLRQTPLLTWENTFSQVRDANLRIGQYKIPYSRERVVSSSKLVLVDRSRANSEFNLDRDIGLDVGSKDLGGAGLFQYNVGVYAGEGRGRFEPGDFGLMYLARFNVTPLGLFDDYEVQDFDRTGARLSLGAAYAFVRSPARAKVILDGAPDTADPYDYHNATVDAVFKARGFSTETAFFWRDGDDTPEAQYAATGIGYYVQPGVLLPKLPVGIAVRYGSNFAEDGGTMSDVTEVGPGLSWYIAGARNHMKLQTDYLRSWSDDIGNGEDLFRVQLQAML